MALFGWCITGQHGYPNNQADERWETGLCPGMFPNLECDCGCHRGIEPAHRSRPYRAETESDEGGGNE